MRNEKIKNYTSAIPVNRIISYIEDELIQIGATHVVKGIKDGNITDVIFSIKPDKKINFKIPANADAAFEIVRKIPLYKNRKRDWLIEQAKRTSWKLVLDWIQIQVAMIKLNQAEAMQVFLPYVYDEINEQTFYERIKGNNFKLLLPGKNDD